jgi:hypothetical protein
MIAIMDGKHPYENHGFKKNFSFTNITEHDYHVVYHLFRLMLKNNVVTFLAAPDAGDGELLPISLLSLFYKTCFYMTFANHTPRIPRSFAEI